MNEEQLKKFKKRLESIREEIVRVMNFRETGSDAREGQDEIDQANDLIEMEMGSLMSENMSSNLKEVNEALDRIDKSKFGKCLHCTQEIPLKRLEVLPFARYCVDCQEKTEHKGR